MHRLGNPLNHCLATITATLGGLMMVGFAAAQVAYPEVCSRDGFGFVADCPQACAAACADPSFVNSGAAAANGCAAVWRTPGADDAAICAAGPQAAGVRDLPLISDAWLEETRAVCLERHPKLTSNVVRARGPEMPECVVNLANLECRFTAIGETADAFAQALAEFEDFGSYVGRQMCVVTPQDVERSFALAETVTEPLSLLTKAFEDETRCLANISEWRRQAECAPADRLCVDRAQALAEATSQTLDPQIVRAGQIQASIEEAKRTVDTIGNVWDQYSFLCGS